MLRVPATVFSPGPVSSSLSQRSAQAPSHGGQACVHVCVCVCACMLSRFSHVWLCVTPWTVAHQAPLSMGFSRQEYWSGLPCPSLGDLHDPGMEHASLVSPALADGFFTTSAMWEAQACVRGQQLCTSWRHRARQWSLPSPDTLCLKTIKGTGAGKMVNSGDSIPHPCSIPQGPNAVGWMAFFPVALLYFIADIYCTNAYVCIVFFVIYESIISCNNVSQFHMMDRCWISSVYTLVYLCISSAYTLVYLLLFSHLVVSDSLQPHELQHARLLCLSLSSGVWSNSCPLSQWCYLTIYPLQHLLLWPSIFPSIRVFSIESALFIRWSKYQSFSISPSSEYSGLISFRINWFDLLAVQGTLKSLLQLIYESVIVE